MKEDKLLVAISTKGHKVALLKNVTKNEYNELLNEQEKEQRKEDLEKNVVDEELTRHRKNIDALFVRDIILAKSIYDNFVDRGLLENDDAFQQMWFDFYFNDAKLELENAPEEYKKILVKVGNFYENI